MASPAERRVLATPELLQAILLECDMRVLLVSANRVCRDWKAMIDNSPRIQQHLFFRPVNRPLAKASPGDGPRSADSGAPYDGENSEVSAEDEPSRLHTPRRKNPLLEQIFNPWFISPLLEGDDETLPTPCKFHFGDQDRATIAGDPLHNERASWRRMLVAQPPIRTLGFVELEAIRPPRAMRHGARTYASAEIHRWVRPGEGTGHSGESNHDHVRVDPVPERPITRPYEYEVFFTPRGQAHARRFPHLEDGLRMGYYYDIVLHHLFLREGSGFMATWTTPNGGEGDKILKLAKNLCHARRRRDVMRAVMAQRPDLILALTWERDVTTREARQSHAAAYPDGSNLSHQPLDTLWFWDRLGVLQLPRELSAALAEYQDWRRDHPEERPMQSPETRTVGAGSHLESSSR